MSRIIWHTEHSHASMSSFIRYWARDIANQSLLSALELDSFVAAKFPHPIAEFIEGSYFGDQETKPIRQYDALRSIFGSSPLTKVSFPYKGKMTTVTQFDLSLNTAMVMGSDPVKLAMRIHGQCELNAFVEGKNRRWLAGIMRQGLETSLFEARYWGELIDFLEEDEFHPVVTSYSVLNEFPHSHITNYHHILRPEEWEKLSTHEQWEVAMKTLRAKDTLELRPDNWQDYHFRSGVNGYSLMRAIKMNQGNLR